MINKNEWLTVGLITSCHGINGQVKVKSLSDFEERFLNPGTRWLQKENEPPSKIKLNSGFKQPGKDTFIIKIQGIMDMFLLGKRLLNTTPMVTEMIERDQMD